MKIKKGTKLIVDHSRKGKFKGIALKDFDTEEEWYPIAVDQEKIEGMSKTWHKGSKTPCRNGLCTVKVIT